MHILKELSYSSINAIFESRCVDKNLPWSLFICSSFTLCTSSSISWTYLFWFIGVKSCIMPHLSWTKNPWDRRIWINLYWYYHHNNSNCIILLYWKILITKRSSPTDYASPWLIMLIKLSRRMYHPFISNSCNMATIRSTVTW